MARDLEQSRQSFTERVESSTDNGACDRTNGYGIRATTMSKAPIQFRIASYNTHKCRGIHGTISPDRVIRVIEELEADILCLQEIVDAEGGTGKYDQARQISEAFPDLNVSFGETRPLHGGRYGNMLMTRFPIAETRTHDITKSTREERGVLQCAIEVGTHRVVNVFNVHLGTGYMETAAAGRGADRGRDSCSAGLERAAHRDWRFQRVDTRADDEVAAEEFPERSSHTKSTLGADLSGRAPDFEPGSLLLRSAAGDAEHGNLAQPQSDDCVGSFAADCGLQFSCERRPMIRHDVSVMAALA